MIDRDRSTCQWIAYHARRTPSAAAFANGDTYHSLALNIVRVMDALVAEAIQPGQVLGVETTDRYLHMLVLLAAEALSVTTISLVPSELEHPIDLGRLCDRIMLSRPGVSLDPAKILPMTLEWTTNALTGTMEHSRLDALERQPAPDSRVRLVKSSGTTGVPKVMGITHRMQQRLIQKYLLTIPPRMARRLGYLCLYNFTVRASHVRALLTLQLGGTIYLTGGDAIWDLIQTGAGNYVVFVTGDLARFIQAAPSGRKAFDIQLDAIGARVPPQLRQRIREMITNNLTVTYSANEVQRISVVDDANIGTLFPDVTVRIVNDRGEPVPLGQHGTIRVRSDTMTDGYIGAPDLTRAAFIDGWYHTNDFGFQPAERQLVVLGRADDMLNVGGVKVAPGPIEERLKGIDGIDDALVSTVDDGLGTDALLVAVETGPNGAPADVRRLITPIITGYVTNFQLIVVSAFPRTETGKVRRDVVRELYRRNVAGGAL